jgi:NAD(P)-dependent dehydrogenase (short-subunit alcohol dehydrogenase family)
MLNHSRKTAVVTVACRVIGPASALALAQVGAQVLVHYGRGRAEAESVVAEIRKTGGRAGVVASDLAAPDGAHNLARRFAVSLAAGWTFSSRTQASRSRRISKTRRLRISTASSLSTFARLSFSSSRRFPFWAMAAALW